MSAHWIVEEEQGTFLATQAHPHQGYYAGDFSNRSPVPDGFERALRYAEAAAR